MAIKAQPLTVTVTAWDTANNVPKTGDAANISIRLIKDGTGAARNDATAIAEVDATNAPGEYSVVLDATDMAADCVVVAGKSATSGVVVFGVKIITERGSVAAVKSDTGAILADTGTDGVVVAAGSKSGYSLAADQSGVTVGTVTDLTNAPAGMALEASVQAVKAKTDNLPADPAGVSDLPAAAPTVNEIAAEIEDPARVLAAIKAVTDQFAFTGTDVQAALSAAQEAALAAAISAAIVVPPADVDEGAIADAVCNEVLSGHVTPNSLAVALTTLLQRLARATVQSVGTSGVDGVLHIYRGADHGSTLPNKLQVEMPASEFGDLTGCTVVLHTDRGDLAATVIDAGLETQIVNVDLTAAQSAQVPKGTRSYAVKVTDGSGNVWGPLAQSTLIVSDFV